MNVIVMHMIIIIINGDRSDDKSYDCDDDELTYNTFKEKYILW